MRLLGLLLLAALIFPGATLAQNTFTIELEGGPVWQGSNTVEVPNDGTATRFSLSGLVGAGPAPAGRLYATWHISDRHSTRLLLAPLSLTESGIPSDDIVFAGRAYSANESTQATYRFNSYRLTYRYLLLDRSRTSLWVGLTGKIRDAKIGLEQGDTTSFDDDLGVLPLAHIGAEWRPADPWSIRLDADALAGGPGRAIDAALTFGYDLNERWTVHAGYRILEGGADVEQVYNFATLHYAIAGLRWRL